MKRSVRWMMVLMLSLALVGCNDDDDGGNGGGGGGGTAAGEFTDIMGNIESGFFAANEGTFNSVETLSPFMAATSGALSPPVQDAAQGTNCLAAGLIGKTFSFNGTQYVDAGTTDGPPDGVRFLLYEVVGGVPNPSSPIGHVDVACMDSGSDIEATITIDADSVPILDVTISGEPEPINASLTGSLRSPDGNEVLPVSGTFNPITLSTSFGPYLNHFGSYSEFYQNGMLLNITASVARAADPGGWEVDANLQPLFDGDVDTGYFVLRSEAVDGTLACVDGGTVWEPNLVNAVENNCGVNSEEIYPGISLSQAQLNSLGDAYGAHRDLFEALLQLVQFGLATFVAPAP